MLLDEAWAEVIRWRQLIKAGIDPAAEAEERRQEQDRKREAAARIVTIGLLVEPFLKAREGRYSTAWHSEVTRYLNRDLKALHSFKIDELSRGHIAATLDHVEANSGPNAADNAKKAISALLSWAVERGHIDENPADRLRKRASNASRERVLSEPELAAIWNSLPSSDYGAIVKLLALTGQRRDEIADLRWDEIDFEKNQIELPSTRTKNKRPHVVPLATGALEILKAQPRYPERAFVFGNGKAGFCGWSACKMRLDARLPKDMSSWRLHDLRRSFITHVVEHGFAAPHVAEAIANHISGHKGGVAGIYNKAVYLPERRAALQAWATHLLSLVNENV